MANGHGGARPGAGRPRNAEKYAAEIQAFNDLVAQRLADRYAALELLADGGYEQITEVFEPAGLVQVTREVITDDGRTVNVKELAFPELPPEQLVCVRRTRQIAAPDRRANEYLVNRILGTPTQHLEVDGDPDGALDVTAEALTTAARELAAWRQQMIAQLSLPSAPEMPPTPVTPTAS